MTLEPSPPPSCSRSHPAASLSTSPDGSPFSALPISVSTLQAPRSHGPGCCKGQFPGDTRQGAPQTPSHACCPAALWERPPHTHFRKLVSKLSPLCTHPAPTQTQRLVQNPETPGPASVPWPLPASGTLCLGMGIAPSLWEGTAGDQSLNKFFGTSNRSPLDQGTLEACSHLVLSALNRRVRLRHFPALQDSDTCLDNRSSPSEALGFASLGSGPCWGRQRHSITRI
ncbi:unnamed protein product [Lepidochelys olivacea]